MRLALLVPLCLTACQPVAAVGEGEASEARIPWGWVLGGRGNASPETPAVVHDVHLYEPDDVTGELEPTWPQRPSRHVSADGRLAVDARRREGLAWVYLVGFEGEADPLGLSVPGVQGALDHVTLDTDDLFFPLAEEAPRHFTICDPDVDANPQPCASDPTHDCYEVTLFMSVEVEHAVTDLWGIPLSVEVGDPKTSSAHLVSVVTGTPVQGNRFDLLGVLEPKIAWDGHLLVARSDWTRIEIPDPDDPLQTVLQSTDLLYWLPDDPDAWDTCDVLQWEEFQPLAHMPYDDAASEYGLAQYPFRDPEGNPIPDYGVVGGAYPWMDRYAKNIFMGTTRATLFYDADPALDTYDIRSRYTWDCVEGELCGAPLTDVFDDPEGIHQYEDVTTTRGIAVAGLWTQGKLVQVDGLLNNTDYGLGREPQAQRMVDLYEPGTGPHPSEATGQVRVGTGRDNGYIPMAPPIGNTTNTQIITSFINTMDHLPNARPTTLREVIWTISMGKVSAEVVFDDMLDPDALIVVDMLASWSHTDIGGRDSVYVHDGFAYKPASGRRGMFDPVHFQNGATPTDDRWSVPAYGLGYGGVRVEPVALGGRHGRGLWLGGDRDGVVFEVPEQTVSDVRSSDWYTSLFVDPRFDDDGVVRELVTFPDGSALQLEGLSTLHVLAEGGVPELQVLLPHGGLVRDGWSHLAVSVTDSGGSLALYVDGFLHSEHTLSAPALQPVAGRLWVGDAPGGEAGFRGWLDELKVIARDELPELACNHARGTLVELGRDADQTWVDRAAESLDSAHADLAATLGAPADTQYVCFADMTAPVAIADNTTPLPVGTTSVRDELLFPEGPVVFGLPRPDSADNTFCLVCHIEGNVPSLAPEALELDRDLTLEDDPRRQPMQPPVWIYGNIPADYAGPGLPPVDVIAPPEGLPLDQWTAPVP